MGSLGIVDASPSVEDLLTFGEVCELRPWSTSAFRVRWNRSPCLGSEDGRAVHGSPGCRGAEAIRSVVCRYGMRRCPRGRRCPLTSAGEGHRCGRWRSGAPSPYRYVRWHRHKAPGEAGVVIQHGEGMTPVCSGGEVAFEVHLPQVVGTGVFKSLPEALGRLPIIGIS